MSQLYMSMHRGTGPTITRTVPSHCEVHARGWDHGIRVSLRTGNARRVQDREIIYDLEFTGGSHDESTRGHSIRITSEDIINGAYLQVVRPIKVPQET